MKKTKVQIKFPSQLSAFIDNSQSVEFEGDKVNDFINKLDSTYGNFKERLFDSEGDVRPYINIFIGKKNIKSLNGLQSQVLDGECISLLLSRAGG